jgi:hypothetical protein
MKHLENYYRNLCEQLQSQLENSYRNLSEELSSQINLLEKKFDISKFKKSKKGDKKDDKKSGKKADKKANKDYDGDGEVESSKDEYFGSKDKAIKKKMAEKKKMIKEGREIHGGIMNYGGFPRVSRLLNEVSAVDAFNDGDDEPGDEQVATQPDLSRVSLFTGYGGKPVEYDVGSDEGLSGALRHIRGIRTGMDAADSRENIRQSELDADKENTKFEDQLIKMAKARKLKVQHQGIGGSYLVDYGS